MDKTVLIFIIKIEYIFIYKLLKYNNGLYI